MARNTDIIPSENQIMQRKNNRQNFLDAFFAFCTVIVVVILILIGVERSNIIMYFGIRLFRSFLTGAAAASAVLAGTTVVRLGLRVKRKKLLLEQQALKSISENEQKRLEMKKNAALSVDGEMDAATVKRLLEEQSHGKWSASYEQIYACVEQMEQMDSYQARLQKLLADNGAERLNDTEDILNQVEQYICRNVRSVLNFMAVADDDALSQVQSRLTDCRDENKKLLQQTRDFIYAMADFLNNQGEKTDTRLLEAYRKTILSTIKEV